MGFYIFLNDKTPAFLTRNPWCSTMNRIDDNLVCFGANRCVVEQLVKAGVEFVVVGGLAIAWHCTNRCADDMDLLLRPTEENFDRLRIALHALHLHLEEGALDARQIPLKGQYYCDLLTPRRDGASFDEVLQSAVKGKLFYFPVSIASPAVLLQMKRQALSDAGQDTAKHRADIQLLEPLVPGSA